MFSPPSQRMNKPSPLSYSQAPPPPQPVFTSPRANNNAKSNTTSTNTTPRQTSSGALNSLNPKQIREFRETFQVLDKDNDGTISRDDLSAMLNSLGQEPTPQLLTSYFSTVPAPLTLAAYLTTMTNSLSELSPPDELMAAFSAFDETDDGVIDLGLLKEALGEMGMNGDELERTLQGFTQRRQLGQTGGDKFRYREFVDTVSGKNKESEE